MVAVPPSSAKGLPVCSREMFCAELKVPDSRIGKDNIIDLTKLFRFMIILIMFRAME